jgi:hypothetical protein
MPEKTDCILLTWRAAMEAKGITGLPSESELIPLHGARIPENPPVAVARWGHVVAFLENQERFGVKWDGIHLAPELLKPLKAPEPTPTPIERLQAWRDEAVTTGRLPSGSVTDGGLAMLSRPLGSPDDVGRRVKALAPFGVELYALLNPSDHQARTNSAGGEEQLDRTHPRSALSTGPMQSSGQPVATPTPTPAPTPASAQASSPIHVHESTPQSQAAAAVARTPVARGVGSTASALPAPPPSGGHAPATSPEDLEGGYAEALAVADTPATTAIEQIVTDEGTTYRWPALPAPIVIYRVIVSESGRPLVPEMGEMLLATMATSAIDPLPLSGSLRFVQVWAHQGESIAAAKGSQPRLIAECVRVGPVRNASGSADFGQVALVWTAPPGASRVNVFRLPPGLQLSHGHAAFALSTDRPNLTGVIDRGGEAGASYVYRMIVEARDASGGIHKSPPVDIELEWPAVLREVTDLVISVLRPPTAFEPGLVDLEWTPPPVGATQIYRLENPLGPGISGSEFPTGALPQMGLTESELRNNPIDGPDAAGRVKMLEVPWPPRWSRVHFVPVTILGQRALPGRVATRGYIPQPGEPRLVDRVAQQVVTFVWPDGATYVRAHVGPVGADGEGVTSGPPICQVTEQDYRRHGGMRLTLQPTSDIALYLTAVRGDSASAPISVVLAKRWMIRYTSELHRRMRVGPVDYTRIAVWAPNEKAGGAPPFVVVLRDDRLPLHARDGTLLQVVPDDTPDAAPSQVLLPATLLGGAASPRWRAMLPTSLSRGYLRLFVSPALGADNLRKIVVIDPPISQLRWGP